VGQEQAFLGAVLNLISFASQGQLLGTQTEIQMWGMKFLGTEYQSTHPVERWTGHLGRVHDCCQSMQGCNEEG